MGFTRAVLEVFVEVGIDRGEGKGDVGVLLLVCLYVLVSVPVREDQPERARGTNSCRRSQYVRHSPGLHLIVCG